MAEVSPCNFCGGRQARLFLTLKDHRLNLPGEWQLLRCPDCGLLYLDPQPGWRDLEEHYPRQYHAYLGAGPRWLRGLRAYGLRRRARSLVKYVPGPSRLLDVGCATGEFLQEMARQPGWACSGVEVVPAAAEAARAKGLEVFTGSLPEAAFAANSFDAVTLWDVLEHLPNPAAALRECRRILKPGGVLLIKSPDPAGGEAGWFRQNWIGYEAPQHLFGFPRATLEQQLQREGLRVAARLQTGTDHATFTFSLGTWLQQSGFRALGRGVIKFSRTLPGRVAVALLVAPLRALGLRSSYTLIARKD